ncbi:MAG: aryl-sulfate sulfotransferase [Myxococcales bacterium]|nr:aryl-sulfate sulfotransferase [Myxococcales bacterium]
MTLIVLLLACSGGTDTDSTSPSHTTEPSEPIVGTALRIVGAELVEGLETVVRVTWEQPQEAEAHLEFRVLPDGEWKQSPTKMVPVSMATEVVLGVPYDADVEYRVVSDLADGLEVTESETITTGQRPRSLPVPIVLHDDPSSWDPSAPYLITSMNRDGDSRYGRWWVFIMDRQGEIVWAQETTRDWVSRHVSVSLDGRALLIDRDTYWVKWDGGAASTIVRTTLDGTIEHTYAVPGLHHPFTMLPDDVIAWAAKGSGNRETIEKVDLDGVQTRVWNCDDLHDTTGAVGGCGSNGLWWDADTDHFLFSFWSTDTVVEVDHASGTHLRWWGNMSGAWTFDPPESQFWWQHGPTFTPQGTLMVSSKDQQGGLETVIREYELDEKGETLREVWNFGLGRGVFGPFMGEAHRLPNGNTLHVYGAGGHLAEAMPDGQVAWEVTWKGDKHNGRTTPFEDLYQLMPD